jgi:hypothetical protein
VSHHAWLPLKQLSLSHPVLGWVPGSSLCLPFSFPPFLSCSVRGIAYLGMIRQRRTTGDTKNGNAGFSSI